MPDVIDWYEIQMVGSKPFYDPAVRERVIDALLKYKKFTPSIISVRERGGAPFERGDAITYLTGGPDNNTLMFRARKPVNFEIRIHLQDKPFFQMDFKPCPQATVFPDIFALSRDLANAFEPDVLLSEPRRTIELEYGNRDSELDFCIDSGSDCSPICYRSEGLGGLAPRTVFGPFLVNQIGLLLLETLPAPAVVMKLDWGGILIDLAPNPWEQPRETLRNSWAACMKHLKPSGFFSEIILKPNGAYAIVPPKKPGWDPGGIIR